MAVKTDARIGTCKVDKDGNIIELQREFFGQGCIFKDWGAFHNRPDMPCYVPELFDTVYTRDDFMDLCNYQENIAEQLFDEVDWQSPSALLDEWERNGEIGICRECRKLYLNFNARKCPYCGADHEGGNE